MSMRVLDRRTLRWHLGWHLLASTALAATVGCGDDGGGTGGGQGSGGGSSGPGPESICGDNLLDEDLDEECDDGDFDDSDGCTTECTEARCGDGYVHVGFEDCDDANDDETDKCTSECASASPGCGNGVVDEGEECDDGDTIDDDECTRNCTAARCGDGVVQAGEACDDANPDDADTCTNACQANGAGCGNGAVEGDEGCDDGNASNADDCLIDCTAARCGDGFARAGEEQCDDGNLDDADFCRNDCTVNEGVETGCPGIPIVVGLGGQSVELTTADVEGVESGSCGGGEAPEIVFQIEPEEDGILIVSLAGYGAYDAILYARAGSCEGSAELGCADISFGGGVEELQIEAFAGEYIWVFADGYETTSGEFSLDLTLLAGSPGDTCPGVPIQLDPDEQVDLTGNTSSAEDDLASASCSLSTGGDIVYQITPNADGIVQIALQADFDAMLYSQIVCGDPSQEFECDDNELAGGIETHQLPAFAGEPLWLVVDGYDGESGPYSLTMVLQPD